MSETGTGVSVRRIEDRRFLTGNGNYLDDMNVAGQTFAYFVRPPVNSFGVKGCGEAGAVATLAALMIAVIEAVSPAWSNQYSYAGNTAKGVASNSGCGGLIGVVS